MAGWSGGAAWIVGGMGLIALSDNAVPLVAGEIGLWQFQAMRSAMVVPLAIAVCWAVGRGGDLRPRSGPAVAQRSAFGVAALMCYFAALPTVGIAQAGAGLFTSPLWVMLIAALRGGEPVRGPQVAAAVMGFVGVCLVLRIGAEPVRPLALVAVAGGGFWALTVVWTRARCAGESAACLAVAQFVGLLLAGVVGLALMPIFGPMIDRIDPGGFAGRGWVAPSGPVLGVTLGIGLSGLIATAMLAQGYKSGASSLMGLFDFSFLIWAPLVAWGLWGQGVTPGAACGMALIAAAGALATLTQPRG